MSRPKFTQFFILLLFLGMPICAFAGPKTTVEGYLASPSLELLEKAFSYMTQKDEEALKKLVATGLVFPLKGGLQVEIVDTKIFSGLVKIRPRGQTIEIWTNSEAIK